MSGKPGRPCSLHPWEPSLDEIAAECQAIRETWNVHRWAQEHGRVEEARTHGVHDPRENME